MSAQQRQALLCSLFVCMYQTAVCKQYTAFSGTSLQLMILTPTADNQWNAATHITIAAVGKLTKNILSLSILHKSS